MGGGYHGGDYGAFGGVIRDILINEEPIIFRKDIYATACIAGAVVYWLTSLLVPTQPIVPPLACAAVVILLRVLALRYSLHLPVLIHRD